MLEAVFVITIQNLQKIAMITFQNTKTMHCRNREKCYCSNKKKVTKNRNQNALKI
jgi:hypothetical protein